MTVAAKSWIERSSGLSAVNSDHLRPRPAGTVAPAQGVRHCPVAPPSETVRSILERGVIERRFLFPENGPTRRVERWQPPRIHDEQERAAIEARLQVLDEALAPASRGELLARVLALLSHYRTDPHPAPVEMRIADDWAEDLAGYPMWAVEEAARRWRRARKFRPQICEVIELCDAALGDLPDERGRLRAAIEQVKVASSPFGSRLKRLVGETVQRLPDEFTR